MNIRTILVSALGGLLSAVIVDLDAWAKSDGDFNWKIAVVRWLKGLISGAIAGMGVSSAGM